MVDATVDEDYEVPVKGTYPQPYADEAPPAQPTNKPYEQPRSPFASLDTAYLQNAQKALRSHIPGDPTFTATVAHLLGLIVQYELTRPERIEFDKAAQAQREKEAQEAEQPSTDDADDEPATE